MTDNAIIKRDGAVTGKIQEGVITEDDNGVLSFPDDQRQTFNPGSNNAGINVGSLAGDPSSPSNGDLWYDSTANELTARINGVNTALGTAAAGGLYASYAKLQEQQASGTDGGTFTAGSYVTRVINTEVHDADGIVTLSSNQFTPSAGDYIIRAQAPGFESGDHKAKLYNATGTADVIIGQNARNGGTEFTTTYSVVVGLFTANGTDAYEIRHRCSTTQATTGLGYAATFGDIEVYTVVELWKLN